MPLSLAQMNFISRSHIPLKTLLLVASLTLPFIAVRAGAADADAAKTAAATATPAPVETKADTVANSVVKVFSTVRYPDPYKPWTKEAPSEATGSGVVIEGKRILTCAHVVLYASQVQIQANQAGDKISAKVEAIAPGIDLAVLKPDDETFFDSHPPLSRAKVLPEIRDMVMAYGYPEGGTSLSITKGIVSRIEFESYNYPVSGLRIQIDAAINPGNSGGPLVTEDGRVVGINSRAYVGADNLGFAIPSNIARRIVDGLVAQGSITRSYVGLVPAALQDLEHFYALALNTGLLINSVDPGSPAARAGLRGGDILLAINGQKVDGRFPEQLPPIQNTIASLPVGSTVRLSLKRAGQTMEIPVVTEKLESRVGEESAFEKWGLGVRKVSRAFARENQLNDDTGVIVIGVQPGFPAAVAGLAVGDIITKLNQQALADLETLQRIYQQFETRPDSLLVEVMRDRHVSLYVLKP